jgi:hypothetical protein
VSPNAHADARAVKVENLDPVLAPIAKNEKRTTAWILSELRLGCVPQPIEAGPQIARRRRHEDLQMRMETQHVASHRWSNAAANSICSWEVT